MHQDWNPIVFKTDVKAAHPFVAPTAKRNCSLEADLDISDPNPIIKPLPKLDKTNQQLMIGMRTAKKLTQVELARRINVTKDIVASLESGKVIADVFILQKVNRALGIKLVIQK